MQRARAQWDEDALYQKAVALLAHRGHTQAELRRKLGPRAADEGALAAALERLREHGYLDEARLASGFALYQRDVAHHGRARTLRELRARGVDAGLAQAAVARSYAGSSEDGLLAAHLKAKRLRPPEDFRQTANLYRKLLRAGFSPAACQRALRRWKLDREWLENLESLVEEMDD